MNTCPSGSFEAERRLLETRRDALRLVLGKGAVAKQELKKFIETFKIEMGASSSSSPESPSLQDLFGSLRCGGVGKFKG